MANVLLEVRLPEWEVRVTITNPGGIEHWVPIGFDARLVELVTAFMEFTEGGVARYAAFAKSMLLTHVHHLLMKDKYRPKIYKYEEVFDATLTIRFDRGVREGV